MDVSRYGVIFDVDGVLVDSYIAHFQGWQRAGIEWGFSITEEQFARTFGRTSREVIVDTFGMTKLSEDDVQRLDQRKEALYREIVAESFPAMPGAAELLDDLHAQGFVLGIGSSGPPPNVDVVLDQLGRRHLFRAIVTGVDVVRGKPDPQVFLLAARQMGVSPTNCVVIEDAPAGIQAARNGNMKCVGIASTGRTAEQLHAADRVVRQLSDLSPGFLQQLWSGSGAQVARGGP